MENFREFQVTDPFGRTWTAQFKYLQTGISIRHSDSIDVRYVLDSVSDGQTERIQKTMVLHHADVRSYAAKSGRKISDAWCSRIALLRLKTAIENAEDLENDYLPVTPSEIAQYDAAIKTWEKDWLKEHAA